jgi:proton-translocating NADH-quinone oxidoreductase chain N
MCRTITWFGIIIILITISLIYNSGMHNNGATTVCYNTLILDQFAYYCKLLLLVSTASTLLMSLQYFQTNHTYNASFECIVLILLSTCSMLLMISAYDLIAIYLAIELQSLCFYVIAASKRTSEFSTEAGLKYFVLGAFSSGILLFGCSLIYGFTGMTNLEQLAKLVQSSDLDTITQLDIQNGQFDRITANVNLFLCHRLGIVFVAVGFLFKLTAVPFHMWAPDVYEGSPTFITAFLSIAPKIALLASMVRVFTQTCFYDPTWQQLFVLCSLASMILGAVAGLAQTKVKRLLAYSSIGHVGYLLIGLACGTIEGIQALLIAVFIYVLMTVNVFAVVLSLPQNRQQYISDLSALAHNNRNPILALTLSLTLFSYAGIPPLAGFCSKFYLFFAAQACGATVLALVGVLTSVISCFYYIRFVKIMYFDTDCDYHNKLMTVGQPIDREKSLLLAITMGLITLFCLYPSPLFLVTHQMALSLCL